MLGWEPTERHDHYDAGGNHTGYTIVTREPEWDDYERDRMLGLGIYERGIGRCGYHHSLTSDPANLFAFETRDCPVCAGYDRGLRLLSEADDQVMSRYGDNPPPGTPRPSDGRVTWMRQLSSIEVAERRKLTAGNAQEQS